MTVLDLQTLKHPASDTDGSRIETTKIKIDKELFKHFNPALVREARMIPVSIEYFENSKKLAPKNQKAELTVAVEQGELFKIVSAAHDYYAYRILEDGDRAFWPRQLKVTVIPTSKEEIDKRQREIEQEWNTKGPGFVQLVEDTKGKIIETSQPVVEDEAFNQLLLSLKTESEGVINVPKNGERLLKEGTALAKAPKEKSKEIDIRNVTEMQENVNQRVFDLRRIESGSRAVVQGILKLAIKNGASDIHTQWERWGDDNPVVNLRMRVDGKMQNIVRIEEPRASRTLSIFGDGGGMAIKRDDLKWIPQDGKLIVLGEDGRRYDLRMSFVPISVAEHGFNMVARLQDNNRTFNFNDLGLSQHNYETFSWGARRKNGIVMLTGPMGSGKSTSLQAAIRLVMDPTKKVATVEDPVEYLLPGAEQIEVNPHRPEMSFKNLVRRLVRRDADIVLIGEIRDRETAETAFELANIGRLVLTSLHCNDSLMAFQRLRDLGVDMRQAVSTIQVIGAQRLVRKIVPDRWEESKMSVADLQNYFDHPIHLKSGDQKTEIAIKKLKSDSDPREDYKNYKGRIGVHEFLKMNHDLQDAVVSGASHADLLKVAKKSGMKSLLADGLNKARQGITSIDEVRSELLRSESWEEPNESSKDAIPDYDNLID